MVNNTSFCDYILRPTGLLGISAMAMVGMASCTSIEEQRPNIILIMSDDMGFSDIGCYGAEINTPNIDRLAENGVKFARFYNGARCCPTRASLLTGLYAHQAGVGAMVEENDNRPGYLGRLNESCVTIAEVLKQNGYHTYMSGKWHVTHYDYSPEPFLHRGSWPRQRGFDQFFGTIAGGGSYFDPMSLMAGNEFIKPWDDFYYTDAINEYAVRFINEYAESGSKKPFFAYVAHVAPHWPLHALPEDIERYKGSYDIGWDAVRDQRLARMKAMGLIDEGLDLTPRDPRVPAWKDEPHKEYISHAMAAYAAQIDRMDQGIGWIIEALEKNGMLDNTLILFLSDNGGCSEVVSERWRNFIYVSEYTRNGQPVQLGNDPLYMPGPESTYQSYGVGWANASNTPFVWYKSFVHEGGIATPFIMHWPEGIIPSDQWINHPSHIIDIMPTLLDIAGAEYPVRFNDEDILPMEGRSLMPYIENDRLDREDALFWEHFENEAIRDGRWKLVKRRGHEWELYDIHADRVENNNLIDVMPEKAEELKVKYREWADRVGVLPLSLR